MLYFVRKLCPQMNLIAFWGYDNKQVGNHLFNLEYMASVFFQICILLLPVLMSEESECINLVLSNAT